MACGRRGFLFGSKWVNEAVYAPGERLRSRRMIQPLRILIGASLECQYRTTRPRPRRNEKLITTPFRSSPATAPNLLEVADLFDGVAQATLKMDGFLERIVYLSAVANHRRTTQILAYDPGHYGGYPRPARRVATQR